MRTDINAHIDSCHIYPIHKGNVYDHILMLNYAVLAQPWDLVVIDLLTLPLTENGNIYLLVAVDHFSKFSILVPLQDK